MPTNAKPAVHKEKEFGIYVLWKSLPAHARGMKKSELVALGLTDPLVQRIIKIKSQTEFAKYFSIKDLGTLTDWNTRIRNDAVTTSPLSSGYKIKHSDIDEKITLPHIAKLQEKLSEQKILLASLKRENAVLKRKLKPLEPSKPKKIQRSNVSSTLKNDLPTKELSSTQEDASNRTIYKKLRSLFKR